MSRARALGHVLAPLAVGGAIYVGFRAESLLGWRWADGAGLGGAARMVRSALRSLDLALPEPIVYVLPDALWVYALTFALARLHARSAPLERALVLSVPLLLGPGAELAQALGVLPGTYDVMDLFATVAAFVVALSLAASVPARRVHADLTRPRALENV